MAMTSRVITAIATVGFFAGAGCTAALKLAKDDSATVLAQQKITAPNPSETGSFAVKQLTYGSGTDKQRPEYGKNVTIKTKTVDVSPFASIPKAAQKHRLEFWGFDLKKAPINARVWYPDGDGPFPLVLIVHGNHDPEKFSDPGYAYLGELLASRGFILASVDEYFINGLSEENDGRAWMLLKHLEAWKQFNEKADGPLYHRVDMSNIALMGHSRGGEAAATAASFNTLKYYPDDFKQKFNFNFAIKSVVAIAPVDGQYKPTGQFTPLENVNYLLIHGSHDGDVSTAVGLRQYERLKFTDDEPRFKAVLFMYRANHGQWNTTWGNKDNGPRSARSLDLRGLIDPEAQRQFAKVVISGFLEATLHNKREYVAMFRDHRNMGAWLPKTMYTTRFQESGYHALADYGEDIDLTTGAGRGVQIAGEHLSTWQEKAVPFRGRGTDNQNHNAAWIGWNNEMAAGAKTDSGTAPAAKPNSTAPAPVTTDAIPPAPPATPAKKPATPAQPKPDAPKVYGPPAVYAVTVPASLAETWTIGADSMLTISLAATNTKPGPRAEEKPKVEEDEASKPSAKKTPPPKKPKEPKKPKPKKEEPDTTPVDLTVEVVDTAGNVSRQPLSRYGIARHPLEANVYIRRGRDAQRFTNNYELVPQTFVLPLADFTGSTPFDPAHLAAVRLVFDKTTAGTVIIEYIGVTTPVKK
jgi:dienelactone hydrolase